MSPGCAANMEEEVDTTNTDEPSTATPRVDDLVSDVELKSPQTIESVEVENTSVAAAIEEIEEINDDYQVCQTSAQLSHRKPTVAFVCYRQTDDIHTFCDLGYLKLIVAVCAKQGTLLNTKSY